MRSCSLTFLSTLFLCYGVTIRGQDTFRPLLPYIQFSTNYSASKATPLLFELGIIRLLVARTNSDPVLTSLEHRDWDSIITALDSIGDADQLYYSVRDVNPDSPQNLSFNSLEHRPPLIFSAGTYAQDKGYNTFGLELNLALPPGENFTAEAEISWTGNYSWSTNFIAKSKLERIATWLHKLGSMSGAGFSDDRHVRGRPRGGGGKVWKKSKELQAQDAALPPKPEDGANYSLHFFNANRAFAPISGAAVLTPGVFYIQSFRKAPDSPECFLLLIRYQPVPQE